MTVVLIHGGGATGAFWDRLVPFLDAPPLVVDLPGRRGRPADLDTLTVDEEVASVVADVEAGAPAGPVTPGGPLLGGLVVSGRGRRPRRPRGGHRPERGVGAGRGGVRHRVHAGAPPGGPPPGRRRGRAKDGGSIILPAPSDPESLRRSYGGDPLDDATLAFVADPERAVADTVHHYFQPVHWSAVAAAGVPVTYVLNERDRPIRPDMQEIMVRRLPPPSR